MYIQAIWVDDCMSTGSSLVDGVKILKEDYNIKVVGAMFLVDRSEDRQSLEKQPLLNPMLKDTKIAAVYDLQEIDSIVPKK